MAEDTQEPTAPEGAPSAPAVESPAAAVENATPAMEASVETETPLAEAAPAETPDVAADWSHLRGLQAVETPAAGWAERADYGEEFAKELSTRAARFVRSVDDSIVLSSDGVMRWLGDPVARIVADEKLLAPRAVLLADDALAGEEREAARNRAALWLAAHVRKLLGPLTALEEGADLPEAARGLGAKIGEALGVLDRERVRNEVRGLDQTTRAAFRKLGVRFGSLYIYVPQLLKPGPRALCTQLWMLKRGVEAGADRLLAFASAGRTSFANDGALSPEAYPIAGFRLCGERVVRVDIVERLSDLIRAATPDHMRSGSRTASEAQGFQVTPQMTSLTGCSGEAFASILRSLNFEPHKVSKAAFEAARRKAPTEPIRAAEPEAASRSETVAEAPDASVSLEAGIEEAVIHADATPQDVADPVEDVVASTVDVAAEPKIEALKAAAAAEPDREAIAAEAIATDEPAPEPLAAEDLTAAPDLGAALEGDVVTAAGEASAESAEEIEIWRAAPRRQRAPQRPPRPERSAAGANRRPQRSPDAERPVAAESVAAPEPASQRRDETPRRFEGKRFEGKRFEGKRSEGRDEGKGDKRNGDQRREFTPRRDNRPADPDSPFAKLAALKPLLEQRDKRN